MLECVRVLADSVMHQSGREFKCSEPRHIKLPPSCGPSLSRLTEALMVHVMSFLDTFVPFDYSAAMNPKAAPRRRGARLVADRLLDRPRHPERHRR